MGEVVPPLAACTESAGCSLQPLRHSLCCGEFEGTVGFETGGAGTGAQWQAVLQEGELLPIQSHILQGYQRVDNRQCMDAEGVEWQRSLQGCNRVLRQEQEEDRSDQPQDRALEPQVGHRRTSKQSSQGTSQGRAAEQGACNAPAGAAAGDVTAVQGHGGGG
jgi:hypothetical protein